MQTHSKLKLQEHIIVELMGHSGRSWALQTKKHAKNMSQTWAINLRSDHREGKDLESSKAELKLIKKLESRNIFLARQCDNEASKLSQNLVT